MTTPEPAAFEPDFRIISAARQIIATRKGPSRDRMVELLDDLLDAVRLSRGPLPDRSAAWRKHAVTAQAQLREAVRRWSNSADSTDDKSDSLQAPQPD